MSGVYFRSVGTLKVASLCCAAAILLAGCSASDEVSPGETSKTSVAPGATPEFSGPWAQEFKDAYERSASAFEHEVLKDGKITDLELSEMRNKFRSCLESQGVTRVSFEDNGGFSMTDPEGITSEQSTKIVETCDEESGEVRIGALHSWLRRNPQNLDEDTIMAACLVRKKAVEPGYTASEYAKDSKDDTIPFVAASGQAVFAECSNDPLGLFE